MDSQYLKENIQVYSLNIALSKKHYLLKLILGLLLNWFLTSCSSSPTEPEDSTLDLNTPWVEASPEDAGINPEGLSKAIEKAEANPRFLSLLVVRDGKLVQESYFNGNRRDILNDVRSVTKSVVSTLVGIALKEGFIGNLDETVGDYLPAHFEISNAMINTITIRDLLTMTGGFQWDEWTSNSYSTWITSGDHVQHVLNLLLVTSPGNSFTYNSGAVHLLGVLLQEAVKMPLPDFADQYLFNKIGIQSKDWEDLSGGYVNGGSGIDLMPRDLARLGQLYLQNGKSGDQQILPEDWVAQATSPKFSWRFNYGALQNYTYGYLWWVVEGPETAYLAWGFGGQFIYVVPSKALVVVATTNWRGVSQDGGPQEVAQC